MVEGITRPGMIKEANRPMMDAALADRARTEMKMNERNAVAKEIIAGQKPKIGTEEIARATEILRKYKEGKANLEKKIKANEQFWKMRQWGDENIKSTTYLWTCIQGRYSDAMDSYPTCNIKPRQEDDKPQAKMLSSIVPVVLEQNRYEETYSDIAWYTLKQGGSVQGIFWDATKHNGLGDITIKKIDLLNFFWEPGITDIQKSANVFTTELVDNDILLQRYPQCEGHLGQSSFAVAKYMYDDNVDTSDKSTVIDWYYHTEYGGRKVLQYVKYVNDIVLFASENETEVPSKVMTDPLTGLSVEVPAGEAMATRGYYDHGRYPFEVMSLYPIEGSLIGMGLTDIGKASQIDVDLLNQSMVENAMDGTTPRYFTRENTAINEEEYRDRTKKFVHVQGNLDEINIRPIDTKSLDSIYVNFLTMKTDELKAATSNQDVHNGTTSSGVTAASAIAALQEAAGKNARSSNREFYRTYREVVYQVIELIRQFYDRPRMFRIAPDASGEEQYVTFDNSGIVPQRQIVGGMDMGLRLPEFDVDVTAEKASPYKKMEMNELALSFYTQGFFNPEMADQALACLEIMDFDHKDLVVSKIQQNQTLQVRLLQFEQLALQLAQQVNPALADQIAQMLLAENGQPIPAGGPVDLDVSTNPSGDARLEAAREQAENNTKI